MADTVSRPGAQEWVPSRPTLPRLRSAVDDCRGCELYADATQAVLGDGPDDAPLLVVGEQPGDKEDLAGEPFVGPAGKLLDKALESAGIAPESVFRTNAVKHFRHEGTRGKQRIHKTPGRAHVVACQPWLLAELSVVRPVGVVLLGATAGQAVYGSSFRVGASRGTRMEWPSSLEIAATPEWVVPTVHPSSILRSRQRDADLEAFVADLRVAASLLP
ncbi:UdgX family uracil-DNA binding protein [Nocardioides caldifontis]|uniref:UdgX family uracil-DNA binding protein n=1 Tax=Nocardioides caldifontis TaxID=2588938 RepID=UPI0011E05D0E|nr:UdgX family uracil-DNA binding protein [Nocardioides caldifontis]